MLLKDAGPSQAAVEFVLAISYQVSGTGVHVSARQVSGTISKCFKYGQLVLMNMATPGKSGKTSAIVIEAKMHAGRRKKCFH